MAILQDKDLGFQKKLSDQFPWTNCFQLYGEKIPSLCHREAFHYFGNGAGHCCHIAVENTRIAKRFGASLWLRGRVGLGDEELVGMPGVWLHGSDTLLSKTADELAMYSKVVGWNMKKTGANRRVNCPNYAGKPELREIGGVFLGILSLRGVTFRMDFRPITILAVVMVEPR